MSRLLGEGDPSAHRLSMRGTLREDAGSAPGCGWGFSFPAALEGGAAPGRDAFAPGRSGSGSERVAVKCMPPTADPRPQTSSPGQAWKLNDDNARKKEVCPVSVCIKLEL